MPRVPSRARVVSIVVESWGKSTVYENAEDDPSQQKSPVQYEEVGGDDEELPAQAQAASVLAVMMSELVLCEQEPTERSRYQLQRFEAALLATVLEDTIAQLRILDGCNTELRALRTTFELDRLVDIKFGVTAAEPEGDDELDGVEPARLRCDHYKLRKFDYDRAYFGRLVVSAYRELALEETFERARGELLALEATELERAQLDAEETHNRARRRELARQLRQQRNHFKSQIYEADYAVDCLRTRVEDATLDGDIRARYVARWQEARTEQHTRRLRSAEALPADAVEGCKQSSDTEQRVHAEVEMLVAAEIDDTLQQIEQWMEKYDRDTEKLDLRTQIVKNDYQNSLERRLMLEDTIEKHAAAMEAWSEFKVQREKERQYRENMMRSAVAVQSWWRGLLVRRQLGPYRPPKKPKAKKK